MEKYLYLLLNLISISYPIYKSFDKRVNYHKQWKNVIIAIIPMAIYMIIWDVIFTKNEVWGFNPDYNLGVSFLSLPIEEWMFFIFIPFSSIFIYEVVFYFDKNDKFKKFGLPMGILTLIISLAFIVFGYHQIYTLVTGLSLLSLLIIHLLILCKFYFYFTSFFCNKWNTYWSLYT